MQIEGRSVGPIDVDDLTLELSDGELAQAAGTFRIELRTLGVQLVGQRTPESSVHITLSKSFSGRIWTAEYRKDGAHVAVVVSFAVRTQFNSTTPTVSAQIQAQLVFEDAGPILDFSILSTRNNRPTAILILRPEIISLYSRDNNQWNLIKSLPIPHLAPLPRDPRGQVFFDGGEEFWAGAPGTLCKGKVNATDFSMNCDNSAKIWSLLLPHALRLDYELVPGRNYFIDRDEKGKITIKYFSLAEAVQTLLDGQVVRWNGESKSETLALHWGSDVAIIRGCAGDLVTLTTGNGDYSTTDTLQAYGFTNQKAVPHSQLREMDGPVTMLWTEFKDFSSRAVVHNLKTGHYEAYEITLACDH